MNVDYPAILWRHDVDCSVHRALALAKIENDLKITSTYFIHLHSTFYSALENTVAKKIREILMLGHYLGLHFDPVAFSYTEVDWIEKITLEKTVLENFFEVKIEAVSWHNPEFCGWLSADDHEICGMTNAYSRQIKEKFAYISDSNGYWRFEPIPSVIKSRKHERIQVLTHPCWWTKRPLSPRKRILRCARGRSQAVMLDYDNLLEKSGRENIDN